MMQLASLKCGQKARILGLHKGDRAYRSKLLAMGLLPGTELTLTRIAPLGDPIEIDIRGFSLSLRKREAALLMIERI